MLYQAYQAHSDVLAPIRLMADAARGFIAQPWPLIGDHPMLRGAAAALEMVSRAGIRHHRPEFGITETSVYGRRCAVIEDSPAGVTGANAAGMTSFGFARLVPAARLAHATGAVFSDMRVLPALLRTAASARPDR